MSAGGFLSTLSPNLVTLLALRFLVGFGVGGLSVPFDLLAEFLPSSLRGRFLLYIELFWTAGSLLVAGIAWAALSQYGWRFLTLMTAIPVTLACIVSIVYLPESARWHLENGRVEEAEKIIMTASEVNGEKLAPFTLAVRSTPISTPPISSSSSESGEEVSVLGGYLLLLSPEFRWISVPLWTIWLGFGFTYYGMILFVARLFSSESDDSAVCSFNYISIFSNASTEVIGIALVALIIDYFGRTPTQGSLYLLSGITVAILGASMPSTAVTVVAGMSRLFIFAASSATWVITPELLPTKIRGTGHSVANAMARVGAALSPFLVQSSIPISTVGGVMCLVNLIAAASSFALPETAGRGLDEIGDLVVTEAFAKERGVEADHTKHKEELAALLT